jgi:hypothetical protein
VGKEKPPGLIGGFSENFEFKAFNGSNVNAGFSGFIGYRLLHWNWIDQKYAIQRHASRAKDRDFTVKIRYNSHWDVPPCLHVSMLSG